MNHVWMTSHSTEGLQGVNNIRWETDPRYVQSEAVQLPDLLKAWNHYLSIYVWEKRNKGDESNQ